MPDSGLRAKPVSATEGKALSDRVCDAVLPFMLAKGHEIGELVEAALACASALERATEEPS